MTGKAGAFRVAAEVRDPSKIRVAASRYAPRTDSRTEYIRVGHNENPAAMYNGRRDAATRPSVALLIAFPIRSVHVAGPIRRRRRARGASERHTVGSIEWPILLLKRAARALSLFFSLRISVEGCQQRNGEPKTFPISTGVAMTPRKPASCTKSLSLFLSRETSRVRVNASRSSLGSILILVLPFFLFFSSL